MYDKNVFINCPFDSAYQPILHAVTFAIRDADFVPRSALETNNTAEERMAKIVAIIRECRYSIHDISRVELPSADPTKLPRFNMPFECGICFGAIQFGGKGGKKKEMLVMDGVKFRLQKTMSDIAGKDPCCHNNSAKDAIACVRNFLNDKAGKALPGESYFQSRYKKFQSGLPRLLAALKLTEAEINRLEYWKDFARTVDAWVKKFPN